MKQSIKCVLLFCIWIQLVESGIDSHARFIRASGDAKVKNLRVVSRVSSRFATTHISSKVENLNSRSAQDVTFTAQLPSDAFICNFTMLSDDGLIVAEVKGKEEARRDFDTARRQGKTTGLVAQKPRETDVFQTTLSVAAGATVTFNLTYQEILNRVHGLYKHTVNIIATNDIEDVSIDMFVTEKGDFAFLKVPEFAPKIGQMTNKELRNRPDNTDALVEESKTDSGHSTVHVSFKPSPGQQGQLALLYDVDRQTSGGEVEVVDGFFVHHFAPPSDFIDKMSARIVFVLDRSGSMSGRKFEQLQEAMETILAQLSEEDEFSVVWFSTEAEAWSETLLPADEDNKDSALDFINDADASGGTNIHGALIHGLDILDKKGDSPKLAANMILFLTDGLPTMGEITQKDQIRAAIKKRNEASEIRIHALAFGDDADYGAMKDISSDSRGLARKIYAASDAALQLDGFYSEVALPLFTDVQFKYLDDAVNVDTVVKSRKDNTLFAGSEMIVIGKLASADAKELRGEVSGKSASGARVFPVVRVTPAALPANSLGGFVERMWAYMTIKKNLEDADIEADFSKAARLRNKAKELALKYNFVTSQTSLVIVDSSPTIRPSSDLDDAEEEAEADRRRPFPVAAGGISSSRSSFAKALGSGPGGPSGASAARGGSSGRRGGSGLRRGGSRTRPAPRQPRPSPSSSRNGFAPWLGPGPGMPPPPAPAPTSVSGTSSMLPMPSTISAGADLSTAGESAPEEDTDYSGRPESNLRCSLNIFILYDARYGSVAERRLIVADLVARLRALGHRVVVGRVERSSVEAESGQSWAQMQAGLRRGSARFIILPGPFRFRSSLRSDLGRLRSGNPTTIVAHTDARVQQRDFVALRPQYVKTRSAADVVPQINC